ncbi:DUF5693 family protein [Sporomusa acidovorans]|uniref:Uncharacterized protein n=1 Tax=Sporomusa acidovorans (strain ATCC 49682 / DSM 3132 / Mol) TaxID=1123286 RepID=A0ABZ3J7I8_SPOA4|nr:DUF5693 family protein [Sporomusa acidovorans]OZC23464.1 hypothetical protein SPACI_06620 [Sporomusa acidovorans DSM 3132]SDF27688.1 Putative negative regulator of RcsB-dependent stress response [Sporomusa acidovorans]
MSTFTYNKWLIGVIIVGLLAAFTIDWQRYMVEQANSTVETVMDYEDIVELAQIEGIPPADLFRQFKEAGVTSLAVYEATLEKLNKSGKITALPGAEILHQNRTGTLSDPFWRNLVAAGKIQAEDVYIVGQDQQVFREVMEDLSRRLGPGRVTLLAEGERPVLAAKANFEKVVKWNLGLPSEELAAVDQMGFYVIARPTNYTKVTPDDVNSVFQRLSPVKNLSAIIFSGEEVLGYPDLLPMTASYFKERHITLGMIEHPLQLQFLKQEGLTQLAAANNYQSARVYVIPKDEQPKLKAAEAILRWAVTDQERNIRINLLRRYDKPEPGKTLAETNLAYVSGVKQALVDEGYSLGRADTFRPYFPMPALLALVMFGATAAGVLLLSLICPFPARWQYILTAVLSVLLVLPILKGGGTLSRQMVALATASVFPALAMTWQLDRWRRMEADGHFNQPVALGRIITAGLGAVVVATFVSLSGGLYLGAVLSDIRFFLEMEIFRGVKLTFVAPLLLVTIIYLTRYNLFDNMQLTSPKDLWRQVKTILNYPVYMKTLLLVGAAAFAAWIFVGRSGHTAGVPVPAAELKLRALLEQAMYARPREKEFLIGHPAFLLAVMSIYRQWPRLFQYLLIVAATIAQGSLVETFAHLRTPVLMSTVRALDGLLLGAVIGIAAVVGVYVIQAVIARWGRGNATHE